MSDNDQDDLHKRNVQYAHWLVHLDLGEHFSQEPANGLKSQYYKMLAKIKIINKKMLMGKTNG